MTALNQINAGARITAAEVRAVAPLAAVKGSDQSVTSSTVLVNDNDLFVAVLANATYLFDLMLDYEGSSSGNLKFELVVPSGASARFWLACLTTGAAADASFMGNDSVSYGIGANGAATLVGAHAKGTLITSSTPGTFQFQWAQNTSNGTATIIHAKSYLALWQVA